MTPLEQRLYTTWISKIGAKHLRELVPGQRSTKARAEHLAESASQTELNDLLLSGFRGFFHQTIYVRSVNEAAHRALSRLSRSESTSKARVLSVSSAGRGSAELLLTVKEKLSFLRALGTVLDVSVPIPLVVRCNHQLLTVQVITMQSRLEAWSMILGEPVQRVLVAPKPDRTLDCAIGYLGERRVDLGTYLDITPFASQLMLEPSVDTFAGTYADEDGAPLDTSHTAHGGRGRKPLRSSKRAKFRALVDARIIARAEVQLSDDLWGLKEGAKLILFPRAGKLVLRSSPKGSDLHELLARIA